MLLERTRRGGRARGTKVAARPREGGQPGAEEEKESGEDAHLLERASKD